MAQKSRKPRRLKKHRASSRKRSKRIYQHRKKNRKMKGGAEEQIETVVRRGQRELNVLNEHLSALRDIFDEYNAMGKDIPQRIITQIDTKINEIYTVRARIDRDIERITKEQ